MKATLGSNSCCGITPSSRSELFHILGYDRVRELLMLLPTFAFTKVSKKTFKRTVYPQSTVNTEEYAALVENARRAEEVCTVCINFLMFALDRL